MSNTLAWHIYEKIIRELCKAKANFGSVVMFEAIVSSSFMNSGVSFHSRKVV